MDAQLKANGLEKEIKGLSRPDAGLCALGPIMIVCGGRFYSRVTVEDVRRSLRSTCSRGRIVKRLLYDETVHEGRHYKSLNEVQFIRNSRVSHCGTAVSSIRKI